MNILLIEPDRVQADALKTFLEQHKHTVMTAQSGQTALDAVDEQSPDVIILEVQLDKHNGIEFLYELRSHDDWLSLLVVVYTSNKNALDEKFEKAWEELAVKHVLYKPQCSFAQLTSKLHRL